MPDSNIVAYLGLENVFASYHHHLSIKLGSALEHKSKPENLKKQLMIAIIYLL